MILLDENIPDDHWTEMEKTGISARKIGRDWRRKGLSDEDILAELRHLKRVTFLTQDADFTVARTAIPDTASLFWRSTGRRSRNMRRDS